MHAFTTMGNHFHLAAETPEQRFNRIRGVVGRPFQGRCKAKHVDPGPALAQVAPYIHLNPLAARMIQPERVGEYRWSSLAWFPRRDRPAWLEPRTALDESGGLADTPAGWRSYRRCLSPPHSSTRRR